MPVTPKARRQVELVIVPLLAALCMALVIGAIVLDRDAASCPPASWHNNVHVTLGGDHGITASAAAITACAGQKCTPLTPTFARSSASSTNLLAAHTDNTWVFDVGKTPPTLLTFRVYDASGKVLAQQSNSLNWTRVGGSEICGGPMAQLNVMLPLR